MTLSSIEVGQVHSIVNLIPSEVWTQDIPASWCTIDFGSERRISPTHYTLRHGGNFQNDTLRNWNFQASIDGIQWTILKTHTQDTSLSGKFATHTWSLQLKENENGEKPSYRYFRILQVGRNSSNRNFLALSGVEFYGDLYEGSFE